MLPKSTWFWNILAGRRTPDGDAEELRKVVLLNMSMMVGAVFLFVFGILNFLRGDPVLGVADFVTCAIMCVCIVHLRRSRQVRWIAWISVLAAGFFFLFVMAKGELWFATYLWSLTFPVITVFLLGLRPARWLSGLFLLAMLVLFILSPRVDGFTVYPWFVQARVVTLFVLVFVLATVMEVQRRNVFDELRIRRRELAGLIDTLKREQEEKEILIANLQKNLEEVKTLREFLPICSYCRKIRDEKGLWSQMEQYLETCTQARVELGFCPECAPGKNP